MCVDVPFASCFFLVQRATGRERIATIPPPTPPGLAPFQMRRRLVIRRDPPPPRRAPSAVGRGSGRGTRRRRRRRSVHGRWALFALSLGLGLSLCFRLSLRLAGPCLLWSALRASPADRLVGDMEARMRPSYIHRLVPRWSTHTVHMHVWPASSRQQSQSTEALGRVTHHLHAPCPQPLWPREHEHPPVLAAVVTPSNGVEARCTHPDCLLLSLASLSLPCPSFSLSLLTLSRCLARPEACIEPCPAAQAGPADVDRMYKFPPIELANLPIHAEHRFVWEPVFSCQVSLLYGCTSCRDSARYSMLYSTCIPIPVHEVPAAGGRASGWTVAHSLQSAYDSVRPDTVICRIRSPPTKIRDVWSADEAPVMSTHRFAMLVMGAIQPTSAALSTSPVRRPPAPSAACAGSIRSEGCGHHAPAPPSS
ncbi:hypothetical protein CDD83_7296 [Cordyceps sp. RAO-2017]|nr:hypothetical protein CDD83_7296 [Cordyceps sp. RAO-2017]